MKEIEAKFRVHPPFVVPDLAGDGSPVGSVEACDEQRLEARYVDTPDLRLARQGVTLRHRTGEGADGWDLKVPLGPRDDGVRDELHVAAPPTEPPAELLRLVAAYLRGDAVQHVTTLVTARLPHRLLSADGTLLAELVDDTVEVVDGDSVSARFREIEVEDKGGGAGVLAAVGKRLRAAGAVQGRFEPKLVRALGPLATAPADPPPPAKLKQKPSVGDVLTAYFRTHVRALLDNDVALRLGRAEAVHDARVAARRLRSTLRTFEQVLVPETAARLAEELAWFADSLGAARDTEVLLARLRQCVEAMPESDRSGPRDLLDRWAVEAAATVTDTSVLDDPRYGELLQQLVRLAVAPPFTGEVDAAATKALPRLLRPTLHAFRTRLTDAVDVDGRGEDFHRARITAKRLRYAVEVSAQVYGKAARDYTLAMTALQDELGAHHDAVVALDTLRRRAQQTGTDAADAFILGLLYAAQVRAVDDAEAAVRTLWANEQQHLKLSRLVNGD